MSGDSEALDVGRLAAAIVAGDRAALARAITLVESSRASDSAAREDLLARLHERTGGAHRVGISGVPGVGKSTFIDALGCHLVEAGHRVAVLAVDPSSSVSGGSILGDKTQMGRLAQRPEAFIRPSPSAATLGGVARRTRETMLLCEAAGYDVVLVETVGVGQSETAVSELADTFVVLMLPGAGDELQGIKKGILELADVVVVNKADGANVASAREAISEYSAALRYKAAAQPTPVLMASGLTGDGVAAAWQAVLEHRAALIEAGQLDERRSRQRVHWIWQEVQDALLARLRGHPDVAGRLDEVERQVAAGELSPAAAAAELLSLAHAD